MTCPHCGLTNPPGAQRCDCGYDFEQGLLPQPREREPRRKGRDLLRQGGFELVAGALGEVAILAVLVLPTGSSELWDEGGSGREYLTAQLVLGFVLGLLRSRRFWLYPAGVVVGQILFVGLLSQWSETGPLILVGCVFLLLAAAPCALGAVVGAGLNRLISRLR